MYTMFLLYIYGRYFITFLKSVVTSGLSILMHSVISLVDAPSYDKHSKSMFTQTKKKETEQRNLLKTSTMDN